MKLTFNLKQLIEDLLVRAIVVFVFTAGILALVPGTVAANNKNFPIAGDREPIRTTWVVATAYSSDVAQTDDTPCIPANGYDLCEHYEKYGYGNSVAANFLPLETQVALPELFGDKLFVVRDRMNARYGEGRIDIWMPTKEEAKTFGVKYIKMEQYGGGVWRARVASK